MQPRMFAGDRRIEAVPASSRGLAYGDGLFETMRARAGAVPWWDRHWARLCGGASALGIALPRERQARDELAALLEGGDGVAKLLLTRGAGSRGYGPVDAPPFWVLSRHPLPAASQRLRLRWCETRLALQPALAGHKHCNRLEQVLARAEPGDADADEGLMLDAEGTVVSAIAGNLFIRAEGEWLTPTLDRCGVRGVCRAWAAAALDAREVRLSPQDVEDAQAVFVCNAVRGILEVARLGDRTWSPDPQVAGLRERLAAENPAFAPTTEMP